jgi:hypothetical protein
MTLMNIRYDLGTRCLGRPFLSKHLKNARRNYEIAWPVFDRVQELHKSDPREWPIGEGLFETVAAEFKIKKTLASKLYYEVVEEIRETIALEDALKASAKK